MHIAASLFVVQLLPYGWEKCPDVRRAISPGLLHVATPYVPCHLPASLALLLAVRVLACHRRRPERVKAVVEHGRANDSLVLVGDYSLHRLALTS